MKNKYFIAITFAFVWVLFFDNMDLITLSGNRAKLQKLEEEKAYYKQEIANNKATLEELTTDPAKLEKFARERYRMKKDDEDIYLFVPRQEEE